MTKDDIQLLYQYDRWANHRVFQAASILNAEKFTRDLGGSFPSLRDTLVHIVGCEKSWLACWKEPSPTSAFIDEVWTRHDALFNPHTFPDFAAVQLKWAEVERTDRICESRNRRFPAQDASRSHHTNQSGAPHATFGEPFQLPSRASLAHDAPACR